MCGSFGGSAGRRGKHVEAPELCVADFRRVCRFATSAFEDRTIVKVTPSVRAGNVADQRGDDWSDTVTMPGAKQRLRVRQTD
jgi:hypothetical protein